jgi:hypothetical protein
METNIKKWGKCWVLRDNKLNGNVENHLTGFP